MHAKRRAVLSTMLAAMLTLPAAAAEPYVTARMLDVATLLPPPPAKGSAADQADMQAVLAAQASASAERRAQALYDSDESIQVVFGQLLGARFQPGALPKTMALFERIGASEDDTLDAAKPHFGRLRPWMASQDVKAFAKPSKSGSYPSGHTTRAALYAVVMSQMVPERQREFWARAEDYAQSRVVGGMHYPTDIEAGWRAGTAMAAVMMGMPGFRTDLEAARLELRNVLGLPVK